MSYPATPRSCSARGAHSSALRWNRLVELLSICGRSLRGQLADRTSKRGLSEPQLFILLACEQAPAAGLGQNDLAASLGLSAAHTSGLVEQLRGLGLLASRRSDTDRRRQLWRLSAPGRDVLSGLMTELSDWAGQLDRNMKPAQRDSLIELLEALSGGDTLSGGEKLSGRDTRSAPHQRENGLGPDLRIHSRGRDQA